MRTIFRHLAIAAVLSAPSSLYAFTIPQTKLIHSGAVVVGRSSIVLEASKNKEKIASRTKWAEGRGYGDAGAAPASTAGMTFAMDEEKNQLTVTPIKSLDGTVTLPGSKSLSNRCLLLAALSEGNTCVENLLESDDR